MEVQQLYMVLVLGENEELFLHHLLQFLLHHRHHIVPLRKFYLHQLLVQHNMVHISHLFLDLNMLNLLFMLPYVLINHNLFYLLYPKVLPNQMGINILYLLFLYYKMKVLLLNVHEVLSFLLCIPN